MQKYQEEFISFAIEQGVLQFGEFVLKLFVNQYTVNFAVDELHKLIAFGDDSHRIPLAIPTCRFHGFAIANLVDSSFARLTDVHFLASQT